MAQPQQYILTLDIGSTGIRAIIFNREAQVVARQYETITLLRPRPGWVEILPDEVWNQARTVMMSALRESAIHPPQLLAIGITNQRSTFLTWNKATGEPVHNFISWEDIRTNEMCERVNSSLSMRGLQFGASIAHFVTRSQRMLQASTFKYNHFQTAMRLAWVLENIPACKELLKQNHLAFGTMDSWILWKLTGGRVHATDYSNISATGLYDPWKLALSMFCDKINIPHSIFPQVRDTSGDYGETSTTAADVVSIFGNVAVPIRAVCADQHAAMFGHCCWEKGDAKVTLGTGAWFNLNTGQSPYGSRHGLYPLVAWKLSGEPAVFMVEAPSKGAGKIIDWAKNKMELINSHDDLVALAEAASTAHDVAGNDVIGRKEQQHLVFVPTFTGAGPPHNDPTARGLLVGMTTSTTKADVIRAMLDSFACTVRELVDTAIAEYAFWSREQPLKVDGGVSRNDYVCQAIADVCGMAVDRSELADVTALGVAFLAGLAAGVWRREELPALRRSNMVFQPKISEIVRRKKWNRWQRAVELAKHWAPLNIESDASDDDAGEE